MVVVVEPCVNAFWILRPDGSYLNVTVPPEPGNVTLVSRFSKSQAYCVVPEALASERIAVCVLRANAEPLNVLLFHSLILPKQERHFYFITAGKLAGFGFHPSPYKPVTSVSRDAHASSL